MSIRYIIRYILSHIAPVMAGLLMLLAMPEELHAQNPVSDSTEVSVREPDRTSRRESRRDRRKKENIPSADERLRPSEQKLDSLVRSRLDSATIARMDSIAAAKRDSIARVLADTTTDRPGAIDRPAFSTARDSIVEDFSGKYKTGKRYC